MASSPSSYATVSSGTSRYDTPTGFELDPPKTPSLPTRAFLTLCLVVVQISTSVFRMYYWIAQRVWLGPCPHKATYKGLAQISRRGNPEELREFMANQASGGTVSGFFMRELLALPELHLHLSEIMQGAHVCLADGGTLFTVWNAHPDTLARPSSHEGLSSELGHCLFGRVQRGDHWYTCFQFENSPVWGNIMSPIHHVIDYLYYKITGRQQGPAGSSPHVDHHPLILNIDVDAYFKARENLSGGESAPTPSPLPSPDSQKGREMSVPSPLDLV